MMDDGGSIRITKTKLTCEGRYRNFRTEIKNKLIILG